MLLYLLIFFFFNDTASTEIYTLSLHDALPISARSRSSFASEAGSVTCSSRPPALLAARRSFSACHSERSSRSEEHTSELQSRRDLVCRLLLEKKKKIKI